MRVRSIRPITAFGYQTRFLEIRCLRFLRYLTARGWVITCLLAGIALAVGMALPD